MLAESWSEMRNSSSCLDPRSKMRRRGLRCGAQTHGPRAYAHQIMTRVEERELKPSEIQGLKMRNVDTSSRHLVPFDLLV